MPSCTNCGIELETYGEFCSVCRDDRDARITAQILDAIDRMPNSAALTAYTPGPPQGVTWEEYDAMVAGR
jgi:hypothetical protein